MDIADVVKTLSESDKKILSLLTGKTLSVSEIEAATPLDKSSILNSARKLSAKGLVKLAAISNAKYILTELGVEYEKRGLPECRLAGLLQSREGITYKDLFSMSGLDEREFSAAVGLLKRGGAVQISSVIKTDRDALKKFALRDDILKNVGKGLGTVETDDTADLLKRNILAVEEKLEQNLEITDLGLKVAGSGGFSDLNVDRLNSDVIKNWKGFSFREYDLNAELPDQISGRKNIKIEFVSLIKNALTSMGFSEMHSNYAESAFWNFDVMMFKQNHPDRDIQDTVYVGAGKAAVPDKLVDAVKEVYESGFSAGKYDLSTGYGIGFDREKSSVLIMRGHTTATTFRYISDRISKAKDKPFKFFSVDKVFRNETMDATHLLELYQIEGIVYDDGLTIRDLVAYIKEFYGRIGIKDIRLKPTYNPYTEPSLEIQAFSPRLKKWVEVGNSGIFRPETTRAFGITKNIIAWGFGMERMLDLRLGLEDIRKLYGAFADLDVLRSIPTRGIFGKFL